MGILRKGSYSIIEYYNKVNEKLTLLINKTIITYRSVLSIITGLRNLANILFSLSASDLPNALAKAQELESNNMRAIFT